MGLLRQVLGIFVAAFRDIHEGRRACPVCQSQKNKKKNNAYIFHAFQCSSVAFLFCSQTKSQTSVALYIACISSQSEQVELSSVCKSQLSFVYFLRRLESLDSGLYFFRAT